MNIRFCLLIVLAWWSSADAWAQGEKPNVLVLFVDDLRPELGCYGSTYMKTPHIDRLAAGSVVFTRQFATVPTCGASRASILTGLRPRTPAELGNEALAAPRPAGRQGHPESFIHQLRLQGYYTVGIGKISHSPDGYRYGYAQPRSHTRELPESWNELIFDAGAWGTGWNAFFGYADGSNRTSRGGKVSPYEKAEGGDEVYADGRTAALAVNKLKELASRGQPFFLGVGFFKPHLPFTAPARYWDLYREEEIPLAPYAGIPNGVHPASLHGSDEFNRGYKERQETPSLSASLSDGYARKLRHAYFASVSYVDAQIGKVLQALEESGLADETIVVLWGDHGWHLGDDRVWGKHTLFDWSLRSPLIIKAPGGRKGGVCDQVVSAVDVYPTLMELCGLRAPYKMDGRSLVPLLHQPDRGNRRTVAYSYFNSGISLRTRRYRLTRYFRGEEPTVELYDFKKDPLETNNRAGEEPGRVRRLMKLWRQGNTGLFGPGVHQGD